MQKFLLCYLFFGYSQQVSTFEHPQEKGFGEEKYFYGKFLKQFLKS